MLLFPLLRNVSSAMITRFLRAAFLWACFANFDFIGAFFMGLFMGAFLEPRPPFFAAAARPRPFVSKVTGLSSMCLQAAC